MVRAEAWGYGQEPEGRGLRRSWLGFYTSFFLKKKKLFILFLSVLGVCCWQAFSSCSKLGRRGLLFTAVHGFLIAGASVTVEYRL